MKRYFRITAMVLPVLLLWFGIRSAGTFLILDEELQKADAGLILMGSIADRVLTASELYRQGWVKEIYMVDNIQYGSEFLKPYGVHIPNYADLSSDALYQLGLPDSVVFVIPGEASSTETEAKISVEFFRQHPAIDTILLISSASHTRRAKIIFEKTFRKNKLAVTVISVPSAYTGFHAKEWYRHRESAKQVFMEYTKLMSFLLVEQWRD